MEKLIDAEFKELGELGRQEMEEEAKYPRWIILDYVNEDAVKNGLDAVKVLLSRERRRHHGEVGEDGEVFEFSNKREVLDFIRGILSMSGHSGRKNPNGKLKYIDLTRERQCKVCFSIDTKLRIKKEIEYHYMTNSIDEFINIEGPLCSSCAKKMIEKEKMLISEKNKQEVEMQRKREEELKKLKCPLLKDIDKMEGIPFQTAFSLWLKETNQFDEVVNFAETKKSGDFGADVIAKGKKKIAFQCKKLADGSAGIKGVQEIFAAKTFYDCDEAVVVTNQFFSRAARALAKKLNVGLWDRNKVIDIIAKKTINDIIEGG